MRQHSIRGMGGRPRWQSVTSRVLSGRAAAEHIREGTLPGAGPLQGEGRTIQNWSHVLSAPRRTWNRHGNNGATAMNALSAGRPRASKHSCSRSASVRPPSVRPPSVRPPSVRPPSVRPPSVRPLQSGPLQSGPLQSGPLQSGPLQLGPPQQVNLAELPPEGTREYPSSALLGALPVRGRGRQSPDQARDMAAELVGWTSGELPGQDGRTARLMAAWHAVSRGPATGRRVTSPLSCRASSTFT